MPPMVNLPMTMRPPFNPPLGVPYVGMPFGAGNLPISNSMIPNSLNNLSNFNRLPVPMMGIPPLPNHGQYNYQVPSMIPMMPPMGLTPLSNPPNFPVMQMPTGINSQIQNQQNKNN
jgi:hypothetical protein